MATSYISNVKPRAKHIARWLADAKTSEPILYNSLIDYGVGCYCEGYVKRIHESRFFRDKRKKTIDRAFNTSLQEFYSAIEKNRNTSK